MDVIGVHLVDGFDFLRMTTLAHQINLCADARRRRRARRECHLRRCRLGFTGCSRHPNEEVVERSHGVGPSRSTH
jgi:hypothetical protein